MQGQRHFCVAHYAQLRRQLVQNLVRRLKPGRLTSDVVQRTITIDLLNSSDCGKRTGALCPDAFPSSFSVRDDRWPACRLPDRADSPPWWGKGMTTRSRPADTVHQGGLWCEDGPAMGDICQAGRRSRRAGPVERRSGQIRCSQGSSRMSQIRSATTCRLASCTPEVSTRS